MDWLCGCDTKKQRAWRFFGNGVMPQLSGKNAGGSSAIVAESVAAIVCPTRKMNAVASSTSK